MERRPTNKYLNLATAKERSSLDQPFLKVEFGSTFLKSGFKDFFISINILIKINEYSTKYRTI